MSEKKKFNPWPYAIFGGYALFALIMIGTAVFLSRYRVDLVTPDYYADQIRYEDRLDAIRAAARAEHSFRISPVKDGFVQLLRPLATATNELTGVLTLYRPSDKDLDTRMPITFNRAGVMLLPVTGLKPGVWRIHLDWKIDQKPYFQTAELYLP